VVDLLEDSNGGLDGGLQQEGPEDELQASSGMEASGTRAGEAVQHGTGGQADRAEGRGAAGAWTRRQRGVDALHACAQLVAAGLGLSHRARGVAERLQGRWRAENCRCRPGNRQEATWQARSAEALWAAAVDEVTRARECVDAGGTRLSSTPWRAQADRRRGTI
jgi:hypothetical protein